ncbi:extracellular solute-binding protein [Clostridium lacusfryxellense]|uniref:extracellular solute-binding protein n=1 Tax=Clostridium lacusfryxellense TaxID=205328 RepID=UPI001C0B8ED5|nr:extracellular solute-binding protein [Clostridium lacusfryxellense]MBU3113085.1 extracellular solute-binding protein [Clostridium lacusfryxellense]
MKKTRALVSILLIVSVLSTGCGSKNSSGSDTKAKGINSSANYGLKDVKFPLEKKENLKFITQSSPLAPKNPNDKLIFQRFEKDTNVHIDWTNYTNDQFAEKKNLDIASGDLPDAIFDAGMSDYDLLRYGKQGIIVPLEDTINQYMPNLKKILDSHPDYKKIITAPDGHIYSLPWIEELGTGKEAIQALDDIPWINKKWLDELGLKMPTTTDELEKVLIAFKNMKLEVKTDVIPMSFRVNGGGEDCSMLLGSFGLGDNYDHYVVTEDGKVVYTLAQDGYKTGVQWLNKLQKQGLIDKEAFTQDYNTYAAKGKNNRYGLYFTWDKANISGNNEDYVAMPPLKGPDGTVNVARTNGIGFDKGRMVFSSSNQNIELTAKWADKCYETVQSVQNNWGTYGDTKQGNIFKLTSEKTLKHLPLGTNTPVGLRSMTNTGGPLAILNEYYGKFTTMPDDAAWRLDILHKTYVPAMKATNNYPPVFMSEEDQTQLTQLETAVKTYSERMKAEWILKGGAESQWDNYLKELEKNGLSKLIAIKQKYYDVVYKK